MTFDFSSDVCSSIGLPEPTWETSDLAVIKGSLIVISAISVKHNDCTIWVRREYNNTHYKKMPFSDTQKVPL
ncbi:hypothetical protein Hanom_Chr05g00398241 [Helianthus anomalus]